MKKTKFFLVVVSVMIAQTAAYGISDVCYDEIADILNAEEDFDMADFAKDLATTVAKIQGAGALAKVPILGSLLGPGSDNEMTDFGITIGCAKEIPKEPAKIKSLLKEIVTEKVKNSNISNNASSQKSAIAEKTGGNSSKVNCIKSELEISANTLDDVADACDARRGEVLSQISGANVGSCLKNDLEFDISVKQIKTQCGVDKLVSSKSSSSKATIVEGPPITDSRNGQNYKTVIIGKQTWMAGNLNYNINGSKCYNNNNSNCTAYGRLYNWATAMGFAPSCNSNACTSQVQPKHRGICPEGWHLPNSNEFDSMVLAKGKDKDNFMIIFGGYGFLDGSFEGAGKYGNWWSTSEDSEDYHYTAYGYTYSKGEEFYSKGDKSDLFSVRCIQD
jgi:hypothetical protein